ncbi:unnamed protein product [Closterium sp. Naga37s-1]|nr:unnamed protein product [Closterium sp. Naga37s-1]
MADVDMPDVGPPTDHIDTSTPEETLKLLYDLDALTQIPEGEFTKDIPPPPIGEFTKPASKSTPTQDGQPGPSSVPGGSGNQVDDEEEEEEEEESDDEYDERPPRSTNPRTLEERLRRELEYIDDMLEQDEDEDEQNMAVPREQWRAADFVEDDMVYASIDVLVIDALRHLQTLEKNSTLRLYTSFIYHYKRWAAKMLTQIRDKLPQEHRLRHVDEIGHYIRDNKKKNWDKVAEVPREYIWLHGPRVTETRLRAYVKFMIRECQLDAESIEEGNNAPRTQPVQGTTVHTLLGRIKACQMAARVESTLYREKELSIMREISVVRSEVRFMVRTKNERDVKNCADRRRGTIGDTYTAEQFRQIMMKVLPTWAASAWNPRATAPSQTLWRFLLTKALTLLSHHTLLRGASIREITLPDIFLYRLASTSSINPENQPVVMVIAAWNSKTSKDARLQQSYAARHLEAELCAVGETGLWLHFILDQIGQFNGVDFLPPLDTTERERWYKKHLFFARNDKEQKELSASSHQRWTRQLWTTNKVFCKRNVHAARAGGAQELAIEGTPRAEIAELGHWALDKMTRAYITAIPVGVVMKKAGYSGCKQDYFLGRSRVEPSDKLLDIIAEHIFPGVDALLRDAETRAAKEGSDADKAAVHFWRTLQMMRRIVAEDLAVKLVRTPWHPYVQGSTLCRIALFQHWAKRVEKIDTETINKRRDPTLIQAEEISVRLDTEYHNMSLKETLKYERERAEVEKIDLQDELEKRDDTIATLTAEITRLTEALRVSEARRMPETPPSGNEQTPSESGSADSASPGARNKKRYEKPPQTLDEARYELNVVQPWRESKTVRDAWRLWNSATADDTRRLCDRVAEPGFVDRHTLLKGATQGAHDMNKIAAPGIGTFCDALTVLKPGTAPTKSKEPGMGVKGLGPKSVSKLRLACALVAVNLKPTAWVAVLFPDTWEEQMPKTVADMERQIAPVLCPPTKRKKAA